MTDNPTFETLYQMALDAYHDVQVAILAMREATAPAERLALAKEVVAACRDARTAIRAAKRAAPPEMRQLAAIERAIDEGRMRYTDPRLGKVIEVY